MAEIPQDVQTYENAVQTYIRNFSRVLPNAMLAEDSSRETPPVEFPLGLVQGGFYRGRVQGQSGGV